MVSFFLSQTGLGKASRNIGNILHDRLSRINSLLINDDPMRMDYNHQYIKYLGRENKTENTMVICGLDIVEPILEKINNKNIFGRRILYPYWELEKIPKKFYEAFSAYSKVIAPSSYIANTLSNYLNQKIDVIGQPVIVPNIQSARSDNSSLKILTIADFDSFPQRKNIESVLMAFKCAFPSNRYKDVTLTVKVKGNMGTKDRYLLTQYVNIDNRIKILDELLDENEIYQLINNNDAFISLHRAEGFGLNIAEAMAYEKIVISTNYGGCTDFVNHQTAYPVEYKRKKLKISDYLYATGEWAEPNIESAIDALTNIYYEKQINDEKSKNGKKLIREKFSPNAFVEKFQEMLNNAHL